MQLHIANVDGAENVAALDAIAKSEDVAAERASVCGAKTSVNVLGGQLNLERRAALNTTLRSSVLESNDAAELDIRPP